MKVGLITDNNLNFEYISLITPQKEKSRFYMIEIGEFKMIVEPHLKALIVNQPEDRVKRAQKHGNLKSSTNTKMENQSLCYLESVTSKIKNSPARKNNIEKADLNYSMNLEKNKKDIVKEKNTHIDTPTQTKQNYCGYYEQSKTVNSYFKSDKYVNKYTCTKEDFMYEKDEIKLELGKSLFEILRFYNENSQIALNYISPETTEIFCNVIPIKEDNIFVASKLYVKVTKIYDYRTHFKKIKYVNAFYEDQNFKILQVIPKKDCHYMCSGLNLSEKNQKFTEHTDKSCREKHLTVTQKNILMNVFYRITEDTQIFCTNIDQINTIGYENIVRLLIEKTYKNLHFPVSRFNQTNLFDRILIVKTSNFVDKKAIVQNVAKTQCIDFLYVNFCDYDCFSENIYDDNLLNNQMNDKTVDIEVEIDRKEGSSDLKNENKKHKKSNIKDVKAEIKNKNQTCNCVLNKIALKKIDKNDDSSNLTADSCSNECCISNMTAHENTYLFENYNTTIVSSVDVDFKLPIKKRNCEKYALNEKTIFPNEYLIYSTIILYDNMFNKYNQIPKSIKENLMIDKNRDFHIFVVDSEEQSNKLKHYLALMFYKSSQDINIKNMKDERYIYQSINTINIQPPKIDSIYNLKCILDENDVYMNKKDMKALFKKMKNHFIYFIEDVIKDAIAKVETNSVGEERKLEVTVSDILDSFNVMLNIEKQKSGLNIFRRVFSKFFR
ncbi:hypothetical protein EDEG_00170 [Edhazardia aedis USNM 41457]|uniref:Uncharacterized protein n=1 Tax=Edhazardia aedis (strain USNM 41457) TaxID=1003232 RepID=J9DQT3_EDHAE|nr:hypothetical protein EDEG_00170 [Edhazardia aedis USNM 41457]|eukprot:EJW03682.1 hypothetical protein EDEG_00170 [Edhazardia aedis USNM 41457]